MTKKARAVIIILASAFALSACSTQSFQGMMLAKMNIKGLPEIENATFVKKNKNLVAEDIMYDGTQEDFEKCAENIYEYLKDKFPQTLGYSGEIIHTTFGMNDDYEYYNDGDSIEDFKFESRTQILYKFVFSSNDNLQTSYQNHHNSVITRLSNPCSVYMVYYKEYQCYDDDLAKKEYKYNIIIELMDYIGNDAFKQVYTEQFSRYILNNVDDLNVQEHQLNLFLKEYDISQMTYDELRGYISLHKTNGEEYYYFKFSDRDNDRQADKKLCVYYDENHQYVKHEIVDVVQI